MSFFSALLFTGIFGWCAQFYGVPVDCQTHLLRAVDLAEVIDWRPWRRHLGELGYSASKVEAILRTPALESRCSSMLKGLEYRASRRNPDGAARVTEFLDFCAGQTLLQRDLKFLMQRVPFWLDPRDAQGLLRRMIPMLDERDFTRALIAVSGHLEPPAREVFRADFLHFVQQQIAHAEASAERLSLHAVSNFSWGELPRVIGGPITRGFVDLERYPPWRTDLVKVIGFGLHQAGNCNEMSFGHFRLCGVIRNDESQRPERYVRLAGRLIGMIKARPYGESSMIALRNVMDSNGRLVLAMGAAYELRRELIAADFGRVLDVTSLEVGPIDFVANLWAWSARTMVGLVGAEDLDSVENQQDTLARDDAWFELRQFARAHVQAEVMRRLEQFRQSTEAALPAK